MSTYNTKLGEFCATHNNWEELLSAEPYSILVKRKDGFVIFNYRQLSSDFSIVEKIGLKENLSPTRANGLVSMIAKIREVASNNI